MQFCLPFIKYPPIPQEETTDEILENEISGNDIISPEDFSNIVQSTPASPNSNPPESSERSATPQHSTHLPIQSSFTRTKGNLKLRDKAAVDADKSVAEYFKAKKIRLQRIEKEAATTNIHNIERKEAIKMFLLSLIPELEELSDSQIKTFKRKVLTVIDEISVPTESQLLTTPYLTVYPHTSGTPCSSDNSNNTKVYTF